MTAHELLANEFITEYRSGNLKPGEYYIVEYDTIALLYYAVNIHYYLTLAAGDKDEFKDPNFILSFPVEIEASIPPITIGTTSISPGEVVTSLAGLDSLTFVSGGSINNLSSISFKDILVSKDGAYLKVTGGLYTTDDISAYGLSSGSSTIGIIENVYTLDDINSTFSQTNTTDTFNAHTIQSLYNRISLLETGSTTSIVISGDGNAVTTITKSGNTITATKGLTFSEISHVHTFASLTNKPNTLAGYGITDGVTSTQLSDHINSNLHLTSDQRNVLSYFSVDTNKVKVSTTLYSAEDLVAYGTSTGSSTGGLIENVYMYSNLGGTFDQNSSIDTFNAYTINDLNTRVVALQNGAALNITTSGAGNAITSVTKSGNTIEFISGDTFSTINHTHTFASLTVKPTTLAGFGITDGVTTATLIDHINSNLHLSSGQRDVLSYLSVDGTKLKSSTDFYSTGDIVSYGYGNSAGVISYDRLDLWSSYVEGTTNDWVLSAYLGYDLNTRLITVVNNYATIQYVNTEIANLVNSAPTTLDTLNELAAALGDDPNFATTVATQIGTKWTQDNVKISNWDSAFTNSHTHSNKSVLDGITSTLITNWNTAYSFEEAYKTLLSHFSLISTKVQVDIDLYSTGDLVAYGSTGIGGGGSSYDRLDLWTDYIEGTTNEWVLSAYLGYNLNTRITSLESSTPNISWGTATSQYVPLTANSTTYNLSISGHTHSTSDITNLSSWVGTSNITTLGIVTSGTWHAGVIPVTFGGTGKNSVSASSMLYASSTNTYSELATTEFGRSLLSATSGALVSNLNANYVGGVDISHIIYGDRTNASYNIIYGNADSIYKAGFYVGYNTTNGISSGDFGMINIPTWGNSDASKIYNLQIGATIGGVLKYRHIINSSTGVTWNTIFDSTNSNLTTIDWSAKNLTLAGAISGATTGSFSSTVTVGNLINSGLTSGYLPYANSSKQLTNSVLYTNGTGIILGGSTIVNKFSVITESSFNGSIDIGDSSSNPALKFYRPTGTSNYYAPFYLESTITGDLLFRTGASITKGSETVSTISTLAHDGSFSTAGDVVAYGIGNGSSTGLITSVYSSSSLGGSFLDATTTDTFNAYTINYLHTRISNLESGSALTITSTGSGNSVTDVSKSGTVITVTKGATYLSDITNLVKDSTNWTTSGTTYALSAYQGYLLNRNDIASVGLTASTLTLTKNSASTITCSIPTWNQSTTGNAATATIWQTARTLTIGNTGKSVNGSSDVNWSLSEIGAVPTTRTITINDTTKDLSANQVWWLNTSVAGYGANVYLTNTASTTYSSYKAVSYVNDVNSTELSGVVTNGSTLIQTYLFDSAVAEPLIYSGTWDIVLHAKTSSTAGTSAITLELFTRTTGGTETTLFSKVSPQLTSNYSVISFSSTQGQFTVNTTDKLGVRVYATATGASAKTIYYQVGDDTASWINAPLPLRHGLLRGLEWISSLHNGTASTFAGFDSGGNATNYTEANYLLSNGSRTGATSSAQTFTSGVNLSNLTQGYMPYASNTNKLLGNSPIYTDGTNVGIGTTSPQGKLHVGGAFINQGTGMQDGEDRPSISITGNYPQLVLMAGGAGNTNHGSTISLGAFDSGTSGTFKSWTIGTPGMNATYMDIGYGTSTNPHLNGISGFGTTVMRLTSSGNVGIGTLTPSYLLDVNGTTRIQGILTLSNALGVDMGGIGKNSVSANSMLYASSANTYSEVATTEFGRSLLSATAGTLVSGLIASYATNAGNATTLSGASGEYWRDYRWNSPNMAVSDLNSAINGGIGYWASAAVNAPRDNSYGTILNFVGVGVDYNNTSNWLNQIAATTDGQIFWRQKINNSSFTDWKEFIHSGNIGSQSVNYATSAGNADTLDGYHCTNFVEYIHVVDDLHTINGLNGFSLFATANNILNNPSGTYFQGIQLSTDNNLSYKNLFGCDINGTFWAQNQKADVWGDWRKFFDSGNANLATVPWSASSLDAQELRIRQNDGTGYGISLYDASSKDPAYGLMFAQTAIKGTHGAVTGNWATYFTMDNSANRGWIFTIDPYSTGGNVASISNAGYLTVSGITSGQITSTVATGTAPFAVNSTTLVENLNARYVGDYSADRILTQRTFGNESIDLNLIKNHFGTTDKGDFSTQLNTPTNYGVYISVADTVNQGLQIYGSNFIDNSGSTDLFFRVKNTPSGDFSTDWTSWRKIWDIHNSNQTTIDWSAKNLTLAGSITGATTINSSGTLNIRPTTAGNFDEGIRIHSSSAGWATIILCGADNTGDGGTSVNSWSIHNHDGDFHISRNGTAYVSSIGNKWGINTNSPSYLLDVNGTLGATTGNFSGTLSGSRLVAGWDSGVEGSVSCLNWFRSHGETGWYNGTYGGGIYMDDASWVKTYNKPFASNNGLNVGAYEFNVAYSSYRPDHSSIEIIGGSTVMGFGSHNNGSWYWWYSNNGTQNSSANKNHVMRFDGSTWNFYGNENIGGTLAVTGASTFTGLTTHNGGISAIGNIVATGDISAYGTGNSSGLIESVYDYTHLSNTFATDDNTKVFNAYTTKYVNDKIDNLLINGVTITNHITASFQLTGTVSITVNQDEVIGTNTLFTTELIEGDIVTIDDTDYPVTIINSDNSFTTAFTATETWSGTAIRLGRDPGNILRVVDIYGSTALSVTSTTIGLVKNTTLTGTLTVSSTISATGNISGTSFSTTTSAIIGPASNSQAAWWLHANLNWSNINYDNIRDTSTLTPVGNGSAFSSFDVSTVATTNYQYNHLSSYQDRMTISGGGTIAIMRGFWSLPNIANVVGTTPTITDRRGFVCKDFDTNNALGGWSCTTQYGFYCDELTKATTNYAIYTAGATPSYFGGSTTTGGIIRVNNRSDIQLANAADSTGLRWLIRTSTTAESGSNVGSDFELHRRADDGSYLGAAVKVKRSTGETTLYTSAAPIDFAGQAVGSIIFGGGSQWGMLPTISAKSTYGGGLGLLSLSSDGNSSPDMAFNVRETDNTDFSTISGKVAYRFGRFGTTLLNIDRAGNMYAGSDNSMTNGTASNRWSVVYAATGTINTSDSRLKTYISPLTESELKASIELSKEIGTYKFLKAVSEKGDKARLHIGLTVQRAIEIMENNNLDPFAYGFICYDSWEEKTCEEVDINGNRVLKTYPSGNIYSFRFDELLLFISKGFEQRLSILENSK